MLGVGSYLLGETLLGIYSTSPAVIAAGMVRLGYVALPYILGALMDSIVGSIRGMGYSVLPMVVTLLGACGLRLLIIATVFQLPRYHTVDTIYLSYPITWTVTFLAHVVCLAIAFRRLRKRDANWKHHHLTLLH